MFVPAAHTSEYEGVSHVIDLPTVSRTSASIGDLAETGANCGVTPGLGAVLFGSRGNNVVFRTRLALTCVRLCMTITSIQNSYCVR